MDVPVFLVGCFTGWFCSALGKTFTAYVGGQEDRALLVARSSFARAGGARLLCALTFTASHRGARLLSFQSSTSMILRAGLR